MGYCKDSKHAVGNFIYIYEDGDRIDVGDAFCDGNSELKYRWTRYF